MKNRLIGILIVGMTMGTAWAIRGQFGHEQGAAWAAAIGALALVLASQHAGWYKKVLTVTLASAIGWGMGGMISYGKIVGYGRSDDFPNAFYGLLMLFVIGNLYGLLGGGLTGLTLEPSKEKKVNWPRLITEMVAGGLIVYGFLVMQLGILMTPPRSEAWAFCLGAALAMLWYMARNEFTASLRIALISGLGAGFGFAFGNFLQVTGNVLQINFNMWNVMEYSIGFFGGGSMAYAIFSARLNEVPEENRRWENRIAFLLVFALIPVIVYHESLRYSIILKRLGDLPAVENVALISTILAAVLLLFMAVSGWINAEKANHTPVRSRVFYLFTILFVVYIAISYLVTGLIGGQTHLNHHLYIANLIVILLLFRQKVNPFAEVPCLEPRWGSLLRMYALMVIIIALLTFVLINTHGELSGSQVRFELK
jgi:hypothetical protein